MYVPALYDVVVLFTRLSLVKLTVAVPAAFALKVTAKTCAFPDGAGLRDAVKPIEEPLRNRGRSIITSAQRDTGDL